MYASTSDRPHGTPLQGGEPPSCKTGADITSLPGDTLRTALVDYAALTFPHLVRPDEVAELLGLDDQEVRELGRGHHGYRSCREYGLTRVYFDGSPGMGVHVVASGKACRELESRAGADFWPKLHGILKSHDGHLTRLDVAIDDRSGALDLQVVEAALKDRHWRGQWTGGRVIDGFGADKGRTIYLGSRQSNVMCRIYDKAVEQDQGGDSWVRVELELKRSHANSVLATIAYGAPLGETIAGILRAYHLFLTPSDTDSNRGRWDVAPWWDKWLGDCEAVRLTAHKREDRSVQEMVRWVELQVAPTLATIRRALGPHWAGLLESIDQLGARRMKARHHLALEAYATG